MLAGIQNPFMRLAGGFPACAERRAQVAADGYSVRLA